jgi:hypothetical protein
VTVVERDAHLAGLAVNRGLLFAAAGGRFLNVREVGVDDEGKLARDGNLRVIRHARRNREAVTPHRVRHADRKRALRDPAIVYGCVVTSRARSAAAELCDLRIDVYERQRRRCERRRFAEPWRLVIDFDAQRPQEACFAEVVTRHRLAGGALAVRRDDEQGRAAPGRQRPGPDEGARHCVSPV